MTEIYNRDLGEIFPDYIGFGLLDLDSLSIVCPYDENKEDYARATYRSREGDLVYDVKVKKESCFVEEFYQGSVIGMTRSKTIKEAFKQKFITCNWEEHPRFMEIYQRIGRDRNVSFPRPIENRTSCTFFPAGTIFILQFPIQKKKPRTIELPLELEGLFEGAILRVSPENEITLEECTVAQFSTILIDLKDAIESCFDHNLVEGGQAKELGLHVLHIPQAVPGSFTIYPGDRDELKAYSILLRREGDIELNRALDLTKAAVVQSGPIQ